MANGVNMREVALDILLMVERKEELSHVALFQALTKYQYTEKKERSFLTRLVEGTLEYSITLDYIINCFSKTKVNKCKPLIRCLLRMSVYQMIYMDQVPASAACNEAVKLAKKRGFAKLSGFVNGVLRSVERSLNSLPMPKQEEGLEEYLSITYSMPKWIVASWISWYGEETAKKMLEDGFAQVGTSIRINASRCTGEEMKCRLETQGITVNKTRYLEQVLLISGYDYLTGITEFQEGLFTVQDESSVMVPLAADLKKDMIVMDVCSAPGGKALHAAELLQGTGKVYAFDVSDYKIERIQDNKERLRVDNVEINVGDATVLQEQYIQKADVVFLDAPCSGMGIMGRKNDMKYRLQEEQLKELECLQRTMFQVVSQYVKPGGLLIYSTCTINPKENIDNATWFASQEGFHLESMNQHLIDCVGKDTMKDGYLQLLQGIDSRDGFFIAKLRRDN